MLVLALPVRGYDMAHVRLLHPADTLEVNELLLRPDLRQMPTGQRIQALARHMLGRPYVAHTLESPDGQEYLTLSTDSLDCTTFVETVLALAYTIGEGRTSWRDWAYNVERLRYRHGEMRGYASRLHYNADWIVNNTARGLVTDVTPSMPSCDYQIKSLTFMSDHRKAYPALADSATFEAVKDMEMGYRNHRFPYIKARNVGSKAVQAALRAGDMVAWTTKTPYLDVTHVGFIVIDDQGVPQLLHCSLSAHQVTVTTQGLAEFLHHNPTMTGMRVIRLRE